MQVRARDLDKDDTRPQRQAPKPATKTDVETVNGQLSAIKSQLVTLTNSLAMLPKKPPPDITGEIRRLIDQVKSIERTVPTSGPAEWEFKIIRGSYREILSVKAKKIL